MRVVALTGLVLGGWVAVSLMIGASWSFALRRLRQRPAPARRPAAASSPAAARPRWGPRPAAALAGAVCAAVLVAWPLGESFFTPRSGLTPVLAGLAPAPPSPPPTPPPALRITHHRSRRAPVARRPVIAAAPVRHAVPALRRPRPRRTPRAALVVVVAPPTVPRSAPVAPATPAPAAVAHAAPPVATIAISAPAPTAGPPAAPVTGADGESESGADGESESGATSQEPASGRVDAAQGDGPPSDGPVEG